MCTIVTGHNWGRAENGTSCRGCGAQEEFYGCADIAVVNTTQRRSRLRDVHHVRATQSPFIIPHNTIGLRPARTTAVMYPLGQTATASGLASELSDGSHVARGRPEITTTASSLLQTQPQPRFQQVIQFDGQPYDVITYSSVFFNFIDYLFLCWICCFLTL